MLGEDGSAGMGSAGSGGGGGGGFSLPGASLMHYPAELFAAFTSRLRARAASVDTMDPAAVAAAPLSAAFDDDEEEDVGFCGTSGFGDDA